MSKAIVAPTNSLLLVMDPAVGVPPTLTGNSGASATDSCVAVRTLMEYDGETTVFLSNSKTPPLFCEKRLVAKIRTPNRMLAICESTRQPVLTSAVNGLETMVEVWTNDAHEPDIVFVAFA
mgnify:CR=1 FL=1